MNGSVPPIAGTGESRNEESHDRSFDEQATLGKPETVIYNTMAEVDRSVAAIAKYMRQGV
jgi:hypothetical protein